MGGAYVNQNVPIEITWLAAIQNGGVIATNFRRCLTINCYVATSEGIGSPEKIAEEGCDLYFKHKVCFRLRILMTHIQCQRYDRITIRG